MYLKKIEALGFKSFPNKTLVDFSHGVTAIVGPNGCGKTNILDALRWVLGEQKPTMLRGGKMEEIIFNGTHELKPLGMAEVSLTIVNDHGVLPTEYHEIQITRRLFRSGESEYLINKVPCRLKDITDLFVDTGVGAHSYSVIQQHMIDSVISDKAEERRFLFEEAAGITKYKQRRKAALRKLEATENDFLRLQDIYAEVKTRVNSLYRQHKKAERYQKLSDQIKAWEVFLNTSKLSRLKGEKRELQAQADQLRDQKTGRDSTLDQAYAQLETDREKLVGIEREITELGNKLYSITEEAHGLEREVSVLHEKKSNARQLIEKNTSDIAAFEERRLALEEQIKAATEELQRNTTEVEGLTQQLASAQEVQAETDRQLLSGRMARDQENKKLVELEGRLSSGRTEENSLREQLDELSQAISEADGRIEEALPRQKSLLDQIEQQKQALSGVGGRRSAEERRQNEVTAEMEKRVEAGEDLSAELADLAASLEACQARRNLLEEMMLQFEGYEAGVVSAMEVKERWPSIAGTVADKFVPVAGMETVLEAALGDIARFLICYDRQDAQKVIDYLKAENKGKAGILVPQSGTIAPAVKRPELDIPGVIGWLDKYVSTDDNLRSLKEAVLSRTVVFETGTPVDSILERLPYGFAACSTDGVLYSNNQIAGGSDDHFPLFRRKEKVAEQETMIVSLQEKIEDARRRKSQNTAEIGALRAESGQLVASLEALAEEVEQCQRKLGESEFENRSLAAEFERLDKEKQGLNVRLEKIRSRQYSLGLDSDQLANQKENLISSMDQAGTRLEDLELAASEAAENVSRLQVSTIEARSRVEQSESGIRHIEEVSKEIETRRATKTSEIDQARVDIETAEASVVALEEQLKTSFEKRDQLTASQGELRTVQSELMEQTSTRETHVKQLRREKESVADNLHQAEIRLSTIDSETSGLVQRMQDEHEVDITTIRVERPDDKTTDEEAPELVTDLRDKLRNFGAVNLLALEEYEVAAEREKFLNEQLADLTTAKNDLKSTITKINHTARQLFNETFEKVKINFQNLFVELFRGGEADISLVDPEDPLESHIDIIARPGGKKLLPITILSGGERALTAIALLFSLYLVKPSPFCILDEIDAPLDDANCQRFLKIIQTFSKQTQFIIITHNKITMQASNNLYGVTMSQPGVSQLVAVRFSGEGADAKLIEVESADVPESLPPSIQNRIEPGVTVNREEDI
ncbi:MAG: chromosome segregation protein SMC [bacterium]|nr:chromosome segregation protein SMC [bacterium]